MRSFVAADLHVVGLTADGHGERVRTSPSAADPFEALTACDVGVELGIVVVDAQSGRAELAVGRGVAVTSGDCRDAAS